MTDLLHERSDFKDLINAVFAKSNIPSAIILKDYWVTEILRILQLSKYAGDFIFKGGTSLSKGYNLINRFSEDVDLLFIVTPEISSKKKKRGTLKDVQNLISQISDLEFDAGNNDNFVADENRTSCFKYPCEKYSGILPYIKMEMGFRGGPEPYDFVDIQSIIGKEILRQKPSILNEIENIKYFNLKILDPLRTFVEKVFSIHRAYFQKRLIDKERHFYDLYCLLGHDNVSSRLGSKEHMDIKADVARYDREKFSNEHIPEGLIFTSSPAFLMDTDQYKAVKRSYQTSTLYYGEKPSFEEIFKRLYSYLDKL
ncbi:MAG: nucleotidyl transferase AbiEii/AbiGii toxin family protein [Pseudomonadota bacterium]